MVATDTRGSGFESSHEQLLLNNYLLFVGETKIKKRDREWPIFKQSTIDTKSHLGDQKWKASILRYWHKVASLLSTSNHASKYCCNFIIEKLVLQYCSLPQWEKQKAICLANDVRTDEILRKNVSKFSSAGCCDNFLEFRSHPLLLSSTSSSSSSSHSTLSTKQKHFSPNMLMGYHLSFSH